MKKLILLASLLPLPLHAALVEMWMFNDVPAGAAPNGTTSIGVNGGVATIRGAGASSDAMGTLGGIGGRGINLPGGDGNVQAYIDLPNGLASTHGPDITINTWMTIDGTTNWARIFDFGSTNIGTGTQGGELGGPGGGGEGFEYIMLSASNGLTATLHRMENRENQVTLNTTDGTSVYILGSEHLWTFVWDDLDDVMGGLVQQKYYYDGVLMATSPSFNSSLGQLNDVNNWLGRSNWTGDANTDGTYDQFAVYDTAFSDLDAVASFAAGPIPEPATGLALAGSLLALCVRRRRA